MSRIKKRPGAVGPGRFKDEEADYLFEAVFFAADLRAEEADFLAVAGLRADADFFAAGLRAEVFDALFLVAAFFAVAI